MIMLRGKVYLTRHAIDRYKERVLAHKKIDYVNEDIGYKEIKRMVMHDIKAKNVIECVSIDDMKFIFTKTNCEYRFERSEDNKGWRLLTVIRYKRMMPNEEPLIEDYINNPHLQSGVRTALAIRKRQTKLLNEEEDNIKSPAQN